jgi:glucose-fructose oxidoreductase
MARTTHKQSSSRWNRDLILSKTFHPIRMLSAIVGSFFLLAAASKRTEAEPPIRAATLGLVHGHVKGFLAALPGNQAATLVAIVEPQEPLAKDYAAKYHLDAKMFYADLEKMLVEQHPDAVLVYATIADHRKVIETASRHGVSRI